MGKKTFFDASTGKPIKGGAGGPPAAGRGGELSPAADALRLKRAYVFEYRAAPSAHGNGQEYCPAPCFDERGDYRRVAVQLREEGYDPALYVHVLFRWLGSKMLFPGPEALARGDWRGGRPPTPAQLTSPESKSQYRKALEVSREDTPLRLRLDRYNFESEYDYLRRFGGASDQMAFLYTLNNLLLEVPALFRYCVAEYQIQVKEDSPQVREWNARCREAAEKWFVPACLMYLSNEEAYREVWGEFLSRRVVREAAAVYDRLLETVETERPVAR